MKRIVLLMLLLLVSLPVFTAPAVNPDKPMRKPMTGMGDAGAGKGEVSCTVRYYYLCATATKLCAWDSHAGSCCNDCSVDGNRLPCSTCTAN